jgi:hypothetical protein
MKKIMHIIGLCLVINANAQKEEKDDKKLEPFIISTELFAPLSISIEKVFAEKHGLKFRYFHLYPEGASEFTGNSSINSYMLQYKYYPLGFKEDQFNLCLGFYSKLKNSVKENNFLSSSTAPKEVALQSFFLGLHGGIHYIVGNISLEANAGMGVNTLYTVKNGLAPYDARANIAIGWVLSKSKKPSTK